MLKLLFVAVLLAFVPLIGRLHSLHILLLGSFALAMVIGVIEEKIPNRSIPMWPGFWFVVGLVVIGSALGVLGMFAASMVAVAIDSWSEGIGQLIAFPIAAAFGFIPLFIYGAWLARQLHGG